MYSVLASLASSKRRFFNFIVLCCLKERTRSATVAANSSPNTSIMQMYADLSYLVLRPTACTMYSIELAEFMMRELYLLESASSKATWQYRDAIPN